LNGISARVLNPRQLLEEKEVYEQIGRTARPKDVESKKILQSIISNESSKLNYRGREWNKELSNAAALIVLKEQFC
jgi:hypothetical protein